MKFLLSLCLLSFTSAAAAQIEMTAATGNNVGIGIGPVSGTKLWVKNTSTANQANFGVRGDAEGGLYRYGLYGVANGSNGTSLFGAYGTAYSTSTQTAYGIYGTTFDDTESTGSRYAGYFSGNVVVTGTATVLSDSRFKVDVRPLGSYGGPEAGVLDRVLLLGPRVYRFSEDPAYAHLNLPRGEHFGFLAEELEAVFPEVVHEAVQPAAVVVGADGEPTVSGEQISYRSVDYTALVPVLVQALQEQQALVEALRTEVTELRALIQQAPGVRRE